MEAAVKALVRVSVVPLMAPELVRPVAVITPDCRLDRTAAPPVKAPALESEAVRRRPVTLAEFMTSAPVTVAVLETSLPITMVVAYGPSLTTPLMLPVPASKTRSPPAELPWPLACAMRYVVRALKPLE